MSEDKDSKPRATRRSVACKSCHSLKVKCTPSNPDDPSQPCVRCLNAKRPCEIDINHTRKRRKKAEILREREQSLQIPLGSASKDSPDSRAGPQSSNSSVFEGSVPDQPSAIRSGGFPDLNMAQSQSPETNDSEIAALKNRIRELEETVLRQREQLHPSTIPQNSLGSPQFVLQNDLANELETITGMRLRLGELTNTLKAVADKRMTLLRNSGMDVDIISRGILTVEQAEERLHKYRTSIYTSHPLVEVPDDVTVDDLRREQPHLLNAIMSVTNAVMNDEPGKDLSVMIDNFAIQALAFEIMGLGTKSVELIKSLILLCLWYNTPELFRHRRYHMLNTISVTMLHDLGMVSRPTFQIKSDLQGISVTLSRWGDSRKPAENDRKMEKKDETSAATTETTTNKPDNSKSNAPYTYPTTFNSPNTSTFKGTPTNSHNLSNGHSNPLNPPNPKEQLYPNGYPNGHTYHSEHVLPNGHAFRTEHTVPNEQAVPNEHVIPNGHGIPNHHAVPNVHTVPNENGLPNGYQHSNGFTQSKYPFKPSYPSYPNPPSTSGSQTPANNSTSQEGTSMDVMTNLPCMITHQEQREEPTLEFSSLILIIYFTTVSTCLILRRTIYVKWTTYVEECCVQLENLGVQRYLDIARYSRLSCLLERIHHIVHGSDSADRRPSTSRFVVGEFQKLLNKLKQNIRPDDHSQLAFFYSVQAYLHEPYLQSVFLDGRNDDLRTLADTSIPLVSECTRSCMQALDELNKLSPHEVAKVPMFLVSRASYTAGMLLRLRYTILSFPSHVEKDLVPKAALLSIQKTSLLVDRALALFSANHSLMKTRFVLQLFIQTYATKILMLIKKARNEDSTEVWKRADLGRYAHLFAPRPYNSKSFANDNMENSMLLEILSFAATTFSENDANKDSKSPSTASKHGIQYSSSSSSPQGEKPDVNPKAPVVDPHESSTSRPHLPTIPSGELPPQHHYPMYPNNMGQFHLAEEYDANGTTRADLENLFYAINDEFWSDLISTDQDRIDFASNNYGAGLMNEEVFFMN